MPTDTTLNQNPYFDDFSEDKNFHRVLFKPSVAVQARELTQLQTILQNQIERFGENIYKVGTIIKGCNLTFINDFQYVKILDLQTDGQPVNVSTFDGGIAVGQTTGLRATIEKTVDGLESQTPDLNTIYIKYINTGAISGVAQSVFTTTENVKIYESDGVTEIATVTVAGTIEGSAAIGKGFGVKVSDGIIFQKGHFVAVPAGLAIVSKYSVTPDGIVGGFKTTESFVTSDSDSSLLDNATGFNNVNAPGADRLKLLPAIQIYTKAEGEADENFFSIFEFEGGNLIRKRDVTQFNSISTEMARRTADESGNYSVKPFSINIDTNRTDANTKVSVVVGSGTGYVQGYKIETLGDIRLDVDQGTDFANVTQQDISTSYGNYIIVDEVMGNFKFNTAEEILLYSAVQGAQTANTLPATTGALTGTQIGTAKLRCFTHEAGTPGTGTATYRAYLFDISMSSSNISAVKGIYFNGTNKGVADVVQEGSPAKTVLKDTNFRKMIFPIGKKAIKSLANSDYTYRTTDAALTISTAGALSIPAPTGTEFVAGTYTTDQKNALVITTTETVDEYTTGEVIDLTNAVVVATANAIAISNVSGGALSSALDVIASFDVKKTAAEPAGKTSKTVYVKVLANTAPANTTGTYSLGLPDVYEFVGAWKSTTATVTESDTDVSSLFKLNTNQRDAYYGLSFVEKKRALTIGTNDSLLFKVKVFQKDVSSGDGFFTAESYSLDEENIPSYVSENGTEYYLRDVIDFRPYAANTAAYSTTIGGASTVTTNVLASPAFGSELFVPTPNSTFETDYEYYLPRQDRVIVDSFNNFKVIKGVSSELPTVPNQPSNAMTLATLFIPPFPSLTSAEANAAKKLDYGVRVRNVENKGYKMTDIGKIDRRLKQLEYYTVLSSLEKKTTDLAITDVNGLDRFKNGILVDPFDDLSIASVKSPEFSASIDPTFKEIGPKFKLYNMDLKVSSTASSNVENHGDAVTLSSNSALMITQPYATKIRNCVENFYKYSATVRMTPTYDSGYETLTSPDLSSADVSDQFSDFSEFLNEFIPLSQVDSSVIDNSGSDSVQRSGLTTTTTEAIDEAIRELQISRNNTNQARVGEFVTDIRFNPYIRSRELKLLVTGLRPGARHYFFFDEIDVNATVAEAKYTSTSEDELNGLRQSTVFNPAAGISADSTGTLRAVFRIPPNQFFVGDRKLEIFDVSLYNSKDSATSSASGIYHAYNFDISSESIDVFTRSVESTVQALTNNALSNFAQRTGEFDGNQGGDGGGDPIAQTFFVKRNHAPSDNVVMIDKLDLFFKTKSDTHGITVMLREVNNGYPSPNTLPFSEVHLTSSQVSVSETAATATTINFDAPIALKSETEYAIVVKPDLANPDYTIWVSKVGEDDIASATPITSDWGDGTLFTSTNDRAWQSYQDENMKFNLYRNEFSATSGFVYLTNKDTEFFTVNSASGSFVSGEYVFVNAASTSAQTITLTAGNTTLTGSNTTFETTFEIGDHVVITSGADRDVLEILTIANNTSLTTKDVPKYSNTVAGYFKSIVGNVSYYDSNSPARLHLDNSTAKTGSVFAAADVLVGATSNASATIESLVNQNVSFVAPQIYKKDFVNTTTSLEGNFTTSSNTEYSTSLEFNNNNFLQSKNTVIKSRSNEITDATGKSFEFKVTLTNNSTGTKKVSSPFVDHGISGMSIYEYQVNNSSTDENTNEGAANTKYISKTVELAEGLDAEDIKIFLTAYRPAGTDIEVYVKFKSDTDPENFDEKTWSLLSRKVETGLVSSSANRFDFKEFEYNLREESSQGAWTVDDGAYLATSGGTIEYVSGAGVTYATFKQFAVKIVFISSSHNVVPRLTDMRAIALSA